MYFFFKCIPISLRNTSVLCYQQAFSLPSTAPCSLKSNSHRNKLIFWMHTRKVKCLSLLFFHFYLFFQYAQKCLKFSCNCKKAERQYNEITYVARTFEGLPCGSRIAPVEDTMLAIKLPMTPCPLNVSV